MAIETRDDPRALSVFLWRPIGWLAKAFFGSCSSPNPESYRRSKTAFPVHETLFLVLLSRLWRIYLIKKKVFISDWYKVSTRPRTRLYALLFSWSCRFDVIKTFNFSAIIRASFLDIFQLSNCALPSLALLSIYTNAVVSSCTHIKRLQTLLDLSLCHRLYGSL